MAFTGKATYSAGSALPELAEDVADIISIVSPYETPLLDHLGDAARPATSTYHEWLEDELLPNTDQVNGAPADPDGDTAIGVDHEGRFRVGDQVRPAGATELLLVTAVNATNHTLTVVRGYGGTTAGNLADDQVLHILGNAALEGDEAPEARFTSRSRKNNRTQIFTAAVRVSGSDLAVRKLSVADELDFQKQERLRELLRDLESTVINGTAPADDAEGSASVRRTMQGIIPFLATNVFAPNADGFPDETDLTEEQLNLALRRIWEQSSSRIDTLVVNGYQKRRINGFITSSARKYGPGDVAYRDLVSVYESDLCRATSQSSSVRLGTLPPSSWASPNPAA